MAISTVATALKAQLDGASPGVLADMLRALKIGSMLRAMPTPRRQAAPSAAGAYPYVAAAAGCLAMPDDAKAHALFRAYARSGTGTVGALTVDAPDAYAANANPAAGHCVVGPTGDILFNGTDAWTSVDLMYLPEKYDTFELTLPVASNTLTLPTALPKALLAMEIEALAGTSVGKKIVDPPGTAVAAGHAALNAAKLAVVFQATDAVTSARVKFAATAAVDVDALLETASVLL